MSDNHAHDINKQVRIYVGVFVALLVGTILTVAASRVHFGHTGNIIIALIIALVKAGLVAGFFMHLVSEKKTIYRILVFTVFFFAGLMALTLWAMSDFPARSSDTTQPTPPAQHHVP